MKIHMNGNHSYGCSDFFFTNSFPGGSTPAIRRKADLITVSPFLLFFLRRVQPREIQLFMKDNICITCPKHTHTPGKLPGEVVLVGVCVCVLPLYSSLTMLTHY